MTQYLGRDSTSIPLLGAATRIYPVNPIKDKLWRLVPMVTLGRPDAGETRYFAYHHCKTLTIRGTTIQKSICGGRFCDRQNPLDHTLAGTLACGCFQAKSRLRFVMQHDIKIPCKNEIDERLHVVIPNFRSYRFDTLLLKEGCLQFFLSLDGGERTCNQVLRQQVEDLVEHINAHHGWTIIGWVRTGRVHDTSEEGNRDAEDIAAEALNPHVIYLYPSCSEDMDESKHETLKILRLSETQLRTKVEQLRSKKAAEAQQAREQEEAEEAQEEVATDKVLEEANDMQAPEAEHGQTTANTVKEPKAGEAEQEQVTINAAKEPQKEAEPTKPLPKRQTQ